MNTPAIPTQRCGYSITTTRRLFDDTLIVRMAAADGFIVYATESEWRDVWGEIDDIAFLALMDSLRRQVAQR